MLLHQTASLYAQQPVPAPGAALLLGVLSGLRAVNAAVLSEALLQR